MQPPFQYPLPPQREEFPDLLGFMGRHPRFRFDEEMFLSALSEESHLDEALKSFCEQRTSDHSLQRLTQIRARHPLYARVGSRPLEKRDLRMQPCFDETAGSENIQWTRTTSGTSGKPLTVVQSSLAHFVNLYQGIIRVLVRAGVTDLNERDVGSVYITDNPSLAESVLPEPTRRMGFFVILRCASNRSDQARQAYDFIQQERPETLASKPHLLEKVVAQWQEMGLDGDLGLKAIILSGSKLTDETRQRFESYFNARVINSYNTSELGYVASECAQGALHIDASLHSAQLAEPDSPISELLVTSLFNACMPLIDYRTGDRVRLNANRCVCGASGPVIEELSGRSLVSFPLPNGSQLSPSEWMRIFTDIPEIDEYQVTQKQLDRFEVVVDTQAPVPDAVLEKVQNYLRPALPAPIVIQMRTGRLDSQEKFSRFRSEV